MLPVAAFAGPDQFPVDCEEPLPGLTAGVSNGVPTIYSVNKTSGGIGPYLPNLTGTAGHATDHDHVGGHGARAEPGATTGLAGTKPKTILRDFGFGRPRTVRGQRSTSLSRAARATLRSIALHGRSLPRAASRAGTTS